MSPLEIAIIIAAGIFLLWLWRGGGQPKPVVASADFAAQRSAPQRCGAPRAFGCLGVLFALMIAAAMLVFGFRTQSWAGIGLALFVGMALLLFASRWGRGMAALGMLALAGLAVVGFALLSIRMVRQEAQRADLEELHWVDDWLDGPAARFSPFHRARLERARAEVQRAKDRTRVEFSHWRTLARMRGPHGSSPIPVELLPPSFKASDFTSAGATLSIDLKPNALSQDNVSPDGLAATLLAMVDLLAGADDESDTPPVTLTMLYRMDVQPRTGSAIPLSQIARIRKESRKGAAERIARIAVKSSERSKRPEGEQIQKAFEYLAGIEHSRQSHGQAGFQVGYTDSSLLIVIVPTSVGGIPVEAALAAATLDPLPATAPLAPVPPQAPAIPATVAAPTDPVAATPKPRLKSPVEGTVQDLLLAYQLLMWTLAESLGGAAEFQQASYEFVPVAVTAPPAVAVAPKKPAEPVAVATASSAPISRTDATVSPAPAVVSRPAWLDGKAEYLDREGVYHMRRSTGRLYQTADESHEAAAEVLLEMTRDYVTSLLGREAANQVSIPIHTILHDFVEATWDEEGPPPGLPDDDAWETHVLLKFDAADRQLVEQTWRRSVVDRNLRYAGASAGLLLALLGTVFGYLKVDTATRGYYSGRLKLATGAVVAAITTLGILLMAGTLRL